MDSTGSRRGVGRTRLFRAFGWLAVAVMLGLALIGPSTGAAAASQYRSGTATTDAPGGNPGAIWTTDVTCGGVDLNHFALKTDVYLNGGPSGGGKNGLPDGNYWVKVESPGGDLLGLSQSANILVVGGKMDHCYQLWSVVKQPPDFRTQGYLDTTNAGGEYKVTVSQLPDFGGGTRKSDNFKVEAATTTTTTTTTQPTTSTTTETTTTTTETTTTTTEPTTTTESTTTTETTTTTTQPTTTTETTTTTTQPTTTTTTTTTQPTTTTTTTTTTALTTETFPTEPPFPSFPTEPPATPQTAPPSPTGSVAETTSSPSGEVAGVTSKPRTTPPPTSTGDTGTPSDGSWRIALIAMAGLLAMVLVLTPATSRRRR